MEVSSQALDQKRVDFLEFDYAIFTNLTRDHLDYHKNIDNYINSKKRLFELLKENGKSIINNDDKYSDNFKIYNYKTYGFKNSDYTINKDDYINGDKYNIPLLCDYNKYNILAAISLLYEMGYKYNDLYELVSELKEPSGRMEVIKYNNNKIIIDYAHTPDALDNVLNGIKKYVKGRIITIVGCGGNRDKGKRSMMGEIATNLSNYVIFTSDNPRYENPIDILSDMTNMLYKKNYNCHHKKHYKRNDLYFVKIHMNVTMHPRHQDQSAVHSCADEKADQQIKGIVAFAAGSVCFEEGPVLLQKRIQKEHNPNACKRKIHASGHTEIAVLHSEG